MEDRFTVKVSFDTHSIPFGNLEFTIPQSGIRYLATVLEHSPYVRNFSFLNSEGNEVGPSEFNFVCPYGGNTPWFEGNKWIH